MKINVFGFKFLKAKLPDTMKATDVFARMQKEPGMAIGKSYRYGAEKITFTLDTKESDWWGGMILKIRDSAAFTKLTEKNGKMVLRAETLAGNDKLAELTYFVAHSETGSGLLAHHYHGTSISSFGLACRKVFRVAQHEAAAAATEGKSAAETREINKNYRGSLELYQLTHDTDLKALVKKLKRVSSFELRLATLETHETLLRGIIEKAERETLKITFPPDADVEELADDAEKLSQVGTISDVKVIGFDKDKNKHEYSKNDNPLVFHVFDYDSEMGGLEIDLDDWSASIKSSAMIKQLVKVASGKSTLHLLTSA